MVNPMSLFLMSTSFLFSLLLPLGIVVFLCVTRRIPFKGIFAGLSLFCIVEIIWMLVFSALVSINGAGAFIQANAWVGNLVQAVIMSLLLALGRYYMNKTMISDISTWRGNCSFGLGYGLAYSLMYFGIQILNDMMAAVTINQELQSEAAESAVSYVAENQQRLMSTQPMEFLLPGITAVAAILIQIALCLVVLLAVRQNKLSFVWIAAGIQTVVLMAYDLLLSSFGVWVAAAAFVVFAAGAVFWMVKSKDVFDDEVRKPFSRRSPLL